MPRTVGIDLGTTNSVVAVLDEEGDPEVIKNSSGDRLTPSVVQFREEETVVGKVALNQLLRFPDQTVRKVKRRMGDGDWTFEIEDEELDPESISALILEKLVKGAEEQLEEEVEGAVITVPADFSIAERQATKNAAEIAGLEVDRLMNEPTAACLRYGVGETDETVLVYDLGGGTFDVTVVDVSADEGIVVDGTRGAQRLGGEDFDEVVYEQLILPEYVDQVGEEPDETAEKELRGEAKGVKEDLSDVQTSFVSYAGEFDYEITREEFEEAAESIVENTIDTIDALFDGENVDTDRDDVDRVLLVGGSTRIPMVQQRVSEYFAAEPSKELDLDLVVAEGAAMASDPDTVSVDIGDSSGGSDDRFVDVVARTIGIEVHAEGEHNEFAPILEQDREVPAENSEDGFTTVDDDQTTIEVKIREGNSDFASDNELLGSFTLENIPPQPAGEPEFRVDFEIDEDGVLHAEAEDLDTGEAADTTLEIGLSQREIEERGVTLEEQIPAVR